jgi:fused signal recognition particle receptor
VADSFKSVLPRGRKIDEGLLEEVHDTMLQDDFGPATTEKLVAAVRAAWKAGEIAQSEDILTFLKQHIIAQWPPADRALARAPSGPTVILVAGINGSGKTTSVAKLAYYLKKQGHKVVLAACDTYRAAAVLQLTEWSKRCGVDIVKHEQDADPGAVAYDACEAAVARGADVLLVDTAGRLHTQDHLMRELNKIQRVVEKKIPGAPHEVLLVLDATVGQNAVNQARSFSDHVAVSGIILAKLDGSAKGGIVVGIRDQLEVPVKFVGLGETLEDLEPFDPETFVEALFAE